MNACSFSELIGRVQFFFKHVNEFCDFTSNDRQELTYLRFTPNSGHRHLLSPFWKNWLTSVLVSLCKQCRIAF